MDEEMEIKILKAAEKLAGVYAQIEDVAPEIVVHEDGVCLVKAWIIVDPSDIED